METGSLKKQLKVDSRVLQHLLKAPDKETFSKVLNESFRRRHIGLSAMRVAHWNDMFEINDTQTHALFATLVSMVSHVLYHDVNDPNEMLTLFDFDAAGADSRQNNKLYRHIIKVMASNYEYWKHAETKTVVSCIPKLIDFGTSSCVCLLCSTVTICDGDDDCHIRRLLHIQSPIFQCDNHHHHHI